MRRWMLVLGAVTLVGAGCDDGNGGEFNGDTQTDTSDTNDTAGGDTGETGDTIVEDTTPQPPPVVSATCVDGLYTETLPTGTEDISAAVSAYDNNDKIGFADQVLSARYPTGAFLAREAYKIPNGKSFLDAILSSYNSANSVIGALSTVVHEGGHVYDINQGGFSAEVFVIRPDFRLSCSGGDTTDRFGNTFARSLLNGDTHASKLPDDFYRDVYLDGNPNDSTFEGGDQGFNSVLEEAAQYVNSLATDYALDDFSGGFSTSARDGILTFLWYIERYLQLARTSNATAYAFILGDSCYRETILTVWGRAWLYLDATAGIQSLGIDDDAIELLVLDEALLGEIQRVREAHGCQ